MNPIGFGYDFLGSHFDVFGKVWAAEYMALRLFVK
jgi:hypothetical protein